MTDFTSAIPQKHRYEKGTKVIRGILDHGSNGWRVELYDTEPLRRTIIEIDALPTWADASAVMSSAFRLVS
ncbi:hypothetical protein [Jiangella mangrovi]|uniref:Uncharacterized protein n=1 Tax=Jiangella mangrovi TaxID=1524084 RepID=A0A7W9LNM1_9ACTN|nr:hypothetical protein [Jiangella mangrovi]MBB5790421.1 hypothetical protein [Jiangella mangrovi]